ncbi:MAG TPA: tryptophan synthase subunit alpha, partial [Xanthobacteraceae bacterium]|nr:tryptophan synthase subunit alpha [Xanthobacteraceae bacterium]
GSALVEAIQKSLSPDGKATAATVPAVADLVCALAGGVHHARTAAVPT